MPGRWKPPKAERTDPEVLRRKKELAEKLHFAVEYGTEDEFVAAVKKFKPDVGREELKAWIMRFHDARRAKRGL
jgi:undecaprenyl pyrophosphate synthase